ncbi:MAG: FAD:protein FMN transferase [Alphaproteobacteria bacterium]|nr:FAD:protein FMN transferase [Alphaproteobacteria bacterium]
MKAGPAIGRRRVLAVLAAAGGLPLWPGRIGATPSWTWQGDALGTSARIQLCHPDQAQARSLVEACVAELRRLEAAFSLYRADSELSLLNRDGFLEFPSPDFRALMSMARDWGALTDGAFDATVQPLWRLYADHFAAHPGDRSGPAAPALAEACRQVDYRAVDISPRRIAFGKPGMAATLNGIAQGYITDRVVDRLREGGIDSTLVEMGEIAGIGLRGDSAPWTVAVPDAGGRIALSLPLRDRAIATSAGYATPFDRDRRFHHLFVPRSGACANHVDTLSVVAGTATAADALSTALYVTPPLDVPAMLRRVRAAAGPVEAVALRGGDLVRLTATTAFVPSVPPSSTKGDLS